MFWWPTRTRATTCSRNMRARGRPGAASIPEDEEFEESNLMHSINGYVYGNLPGLT